MGKSKKYLYAAAIILIVLILWSTWSTSREYLTKKEKQQREKQKAQKKKKQQPPKKKKAEVKGLPSVSKVKGSSGITPATLTEEEIEEKKIKDGGVPATEEYLF